MSPTDSAKSQHFDSLDAAARAVAALPPTARTLRGARTAAQVLHHCAASIELSLSGYPQHRPAIVRATVGRVALRWFLFRGAMRHNLDAGIPGVPDAAGDADLHAARARLLAAIAAFQAATAPPVAHFVYGRVRKDEYARLHAMHIADHLSAIQ